MTKTVFDFNVGDTNFIALVNPDRYNSFVDENWDLSILKEHFLAETKEGNILVLQMTEEGIESDWKIQIDFDTQKNTSGYQEDVGYICVTDKRLCFVEYTCLTMAAQFSDHMIPDKYCEKFVFKIENGIYKVDIIKYFDVDNDKHTGRKDIDLLLNFTKVTNIKNASPKIYWNTF